MANRRAILLGGVAVAAAAGGAALWIGQDPVPDGEFPLQLSDAEWRDRLDPAEYDVLRQGATEPPFSSDLVEEERPGIYACAGCGQDVYASEVKFYSESGWPSFSSAIEGGTGTQPDPSLQGMLTEEHCANCGGHLGHIFEDGPEPTGRRHCINGLALDFKAA